MISVQNRVPNPGQEGRVLITPETGAPFYATLAMADGATQPGTPWNRLTGNLLQADIRSYPVARGQSVTAGRVVDVTSSDAPPTVGQYVPGAIQMQNVPVGSFITRAENGVQQYYLVVHHGLPSDMYDASCDGTWVLRLDTYENAVWDADNSNVLPGADIFTTMAGMLSLFDEETQAAIKTVKIPYCVGGGQSAVKSGADGLECQIFPLSGYELGWTTETNSYFPVDGAALSYFQNAESRDPKRISYLNDEATRQWIRSQDTRSTSNVLSVIQSGIYGNYSANSSWGIRPAFILDPTFEVDGYYESASGIITTSGTPSQAIALQSGSAGDVINVIFSGMAELSGVTQGQQITSPGVQGFGAMDEWLSVFPGWLFSTINESAVKIATGSYTGTGTHGADNPVVITSPFSGIQALIVSAQSNNQYCSRLVLVYGQTSAGSSDYTRRGVVVNWSTPGEVSFYNTSYEDAQMNVSGITYFYAIFGFEVST